MAGFVSQHFYPFLINLVVMVKKTSCHLCPPPPPSVYVKDIFPSFEQNRLVSMETEVWLQRSFIFPIPAFCTRNACHDAKKIQNCRSQGHPLFILTAWRVSLFEPLCFGKKHLSVSPFLGGERDNLLAILLAENRATACFNCFSTAAQRLRICQYFWGYKSEKHQTCLGTLDTAFRPFSKTQVDVSEIEKLKDAFGRVVFYLEEKGISKVPFQHAVPRAVKEVEKEVEQLKAAPSCIPPCGYQKEAHQYKCSSCSIVDCQLPIDCPSKVQDIHKLEGDATFLNCEVTFQTSSDRTFRWKFIKDIRTEELFLFQVLNFGVNPSLLIRPTLGSHHGTFACELEEEGDVVIRKFFYVNVTVKRLEKEKKLQEMFKAILNSPPEAVQEEVAENKLPSFKDLLSQPDYLRKREVIVLILGITVTSLLLTLAVLSLYRWATDFKT